MDFDFSDEQRLIKDSVERLLADHCDFETRQKNAASPAGWSADLWTRYGELGLLGLPFAESLGGFGAGPVETMIVMEAMGRALALEPYLASIVMAGGVLACKQGQALARQLVPRVADGSLRLALAHGERAAGYDLTHVATTARREGQSWVLDGEKSLVLHGADAHMLFVSARTAGGVSERGGIGLFLVDAAAQGVSRRGYRCQDGMRAAEVALAGVRVAPDHVVGDPEDALPLIEHVVERAIAALCAEAVGAMDEMHRMSVDYLKLRKQFGAPIGSFQVLQHRAADMFIALEQARSMAVLATMMVDEADAGTRAKTIAAAKVQIGRSGRFIGQQAIQLHGGVGMTMEYKVGHYFKRITMIDALFGDAAHHLGRLARAGSLIAA